MKIRAKQLSEKERMATLDALYTAAGSVSGREATKTFLRDLLTESERIMLGRRILIARQLLSGASTREISASLGVGLDTVAKIDRWLEDQIPGYELALKGLEKEYKKRGVRADTAARFRMLKKKYPLHFLFFPLPK